MNSGEGHDCNLGHFHKPTCFAINTQQMHTCHIARGVQGGLRTKHMSNMVMEFASRHDRTREEMCLKVSVCPDSDVGVAMHETTLTLLVETAGHSPHQPLY